jgi:hypothetical protein
MWREEAATAMWKWRGKVQYVLNGEALSFCAWLELVDVLLGLLPQANANVPEMKRR